MLKVLHTDERNAPLTPPNTSPAKPDEGADGSTTSEESAKPVQASKGRPRGRGRGRGRARGRGSRGKKA